MRSILLPENSTTHLPLRHRRKLKTEKHKPGKHPRGGGWQHKGATADHATIREWFTFYPVSNFAVVSGVDSVVLDLDVRPGKNGVIELEQLAAGAGQEVPKTITTLSGSGTGAMHLYFRIPPNLDGLQKPKGTRGIDFQRNRQAVIVPGSFHESGHFYRFAPGLSPAEVELAEIPQWLLGAMEKPPAVTRTTNVVTENVDELFDELLKIGPPPGAMPPGRSRPD